MARASSTCKKRVWVRWLWMRTLVAGGVSGSWGYIGISKKDKGRGTNHEILAFVIRSKSFLSVDVDELAGDSRWRSQRQTSHSLYACWLSTAIIHAQSNHFQTLLKGFDRHLAFVLSRFVLFSLPTGPIHVLCQPDALFVLAGKANSVIRN
jgi:hypothetical protein